MNLKNKIYQKLKQVPRGKVITYKELAKAVNSSAYRHVGRCMAENKDTKHIPCYKVAKSNGEIANYSGTGGIKTKIKLLKKDNLEVINGKVDLKKCGFRLR
ncbi:MGMT family protein [Candidatus Pacearchaeota archaeon]|nr:MGMT family protein [Candidatus Pacearchaeota archaeon]